METSPNHQIYHKEGSKGKEQNRLWMWVLLGSNHDVCFRDVLVTNPTSFLLLSLCWPSVESLNCSSLRIQFSAEKLDLVKRVFSHQLMLKYHVFWTSWIVPVQCWIVFKVGKITAVGHVYLMIIHSVKLQFTGDYIHSTLVLEKAILGKSLAEYLPLLSHIGFSLKFFFFLNNGIHVIWS